MSGLLFIITIPRKENECSLRKLSPTLTHEREKPERCHQNIRHLKSSLVKEANIVLSKCRSTDCLNDNDKDSSLYKSVSENNIAENKPFGVENKGYLKNSWEELKHIVRSKRNKLNITYPKRVVDIGPRNYPPTTPMENILTEILRQLNISNAVWTNTTKDDFCQVTFTLQSSNHCEELLEVLRAFGIGIRYKSSVCVIPCALYYQCQQKAVNSDEQLGFDSGNRDTAWSRFTSSVRARNNLAQVVKEVRSGGILTFDWLFLLIVAAFVAAIGLVENSTVILVASMLISPLMGPITAGTLGTAIKDRSLQRLGLQNELMGLALSLVIGFVFGLTICAVDEHYGVGDWPTNEMLSRCEIRSLWIGVLVAIPSGAGVALAVLSEYTASLVGVAISASLLPPAVNAGLLWAMSLVHFIFIEDQNKWTGIITSSIYSSNPAMELAVLGTVSLCLTLVNIICIFLAGVAVYKIKEVSPLQKKNIPWWRNKSFMQSPKKSTDAMWEKYDQWYQKPAHQPATSDKPTESDLIRSDTITFRRHKIDARIPTVSFENIESSLQLSEDQETYPRDASITTTSTATMKSEDRDEIHNTGTIYEDIHSISHDENVQNPSSANLPTIEPSLSMTIEAKRKGLVLSNRSFHV